MAAEVRVLVLAGLDPSGRAGLLADGEAIREQGATPVLCATGIAAQSTRRLVGLYPVTPAALEAQVRGALEDGPIGAIKLGMLGSVALLEALEVLLAGPLAKIPVVFDPVLATSRGGALFEGALESLASLIAWSRLVTPNLGEAALLTGLSVVREEEMLPAARELLLRGARAVLLKGGHLPEEEGAPADLLLEGGEARWYRGERLPDRRGTGCRLASGIAARLALGDALGEAVARAREAVARYLLQMDLSSPSPSAGPPRRSW